MTTPGSTLLILGAACSAVAALLHLGCIVFGGAWYRALGAGEAMARMAEAGRWHPTLVTLGISSVLIVWSLYALSGAGYFYRLPLLRTALVAITAIYLLRGFAFMPLMSKFPDNSLTFWIVSSTICALIGVIHLVGLILAWPRLSGYAD